MEESDRTCLCTNKWNPFSVWRYCEENFSKGVKISPQYAGRPTGMLFSLESSIHPFISHLANKLVNKSLEEKAETMRTPEFKKRF